MPGAAQAVADGGAVTVAAGPGAKWYPAACARDFDSISSVGSSSSDGSDSSDAGDDAGGGRCRVCRAKRPWMLRCRNADVSIRGLPRCRGYWCTGCYRAEEGLFHSFRPDQQGLRMRRMDSSVRAFRCHLCDVQAMLGRAARPASNPRDWELLQLSIQYKIDARLAVLESTGTKYFNDFNTLGAHARAYGVGVLPDVLPEASPAYNPSLLVGTAMVRATSSLHRSKRGVAVTVGFGTARAKRTALNWAARFQPDAQASFQTDPEFLDFCSGLPKRVGNVVGQAYPLDVGTLLALLRDSDALITELEATGDHTAALLEASYRLTLTIAYFAITRGNEPFKLRTRHFAAGLWLGDEARRGGVTPHIRVAFNFPTKALQTKWTDGILAGTTASGVKIGEYAEHYLRARSLYGPQRRGEWADADGLLLPAPAGGKQTGAAFIRAFLLPRLRALQATGTHKPLYRADLAAGRINMWTIRIGAESWALAGDPRAPAMNETDIDAHVGWLSGRNGNKNARTMARRYNTPPIESRIRATSVHM